MRPTSKSPQRIAKDIRGKNDKQSPDSKISGNNKSPPKNQVKTLQPAIVPKFILEKCTTIRFLKLNGEMEEKKLDVRIKTYTELQRIISRYTKNSKRMYTIRTEKNEPILATSFTSYDIIKVKEIALKANEQELKHLSIHWDKDEYNQIVNTKRVSLVSKGNKDDEGWDD